MHHIDLKLDTKLVVQNLRRMNSLQKDVLKVEIINLSEVDFIYLVYDSEWVSLVVIIYKPNSKWRVCVDFLRSMHGQSGITTSSFSR